MVEPSLCVCHIFVFATCRRMVILASHFSAHQEKVRGVVTLLSFRCNTGVDCIPYTGAVHHLHSGCCGCVGKASPWPFICFLTIPGCCLNFFSLSFVSLCKRASG